VLSLKQVKDALVQQGVNAGFVEDNKKSRAAAAKQIYVHAVVQFDIQINQ